MAVKICTVGGACISCNRTLEATADLLERLEKDGRKYFCCGRACVRIDQITTLTEVGREPDDGDDDRWGGLDLGHPDIVIVTGGYPSRRRPRATPVEPGEPWTLEEETSDRGSGGE